MSEVVTIDTGQAEWFGSACAGSCIHLESEASSVGALLMNAGMPGTVPVLTRELAAEIQGLGSILTSASAAATLADGAGFGFFAGGFNAFPAIGDSDLTAEEREALVDDLVELMTNPNAIGKMSPEEIDELLSKLEKYLDAPDFLEELFDKLGPEGVLEIPARLADLAQYSTYAGLPYFNQGDEGPYAELVAFQDRIMKALGTALGNASTSGVLDADFDDALAQLAIESPVDAWSLTQVLRNGDYDTEFILTIANDLDEYERVDNAGTVGLWGGRWDSSGLSTRGYTLGSESGAQDYDPMVGVMEALGRNPEAAQEFLYPDGVSEVGDPSDRSAYYIRDRYWSGDEFDALGQMLDAAATAYREADDPRAVTSAQVASDTINLLAERDGGRNNVRIGDEGKDSLGHILATYIADFDFVARNPGPDVPFGATETAGPWMDGMGPGAKWLPDALQTVAKEVLTDEDALEQVANAARTLNGFRLSDSIAAGLSADGVENVVSAGAELNGFIVGAAGLGAEESGRRDDERAKALIKFLGDASGMVPLPGGTLVKFVVGQGKSLGQQYVTGTYTGNEAAAKADSFDFAVDTKNSLLIAAGVEIGEAGKFENPLMSNGKPYPWFVPNPKKSGTFIFDAGAATSDDHVAEFLDYIQGTDSGYLGIGSQVNADFAEGERNGRGGK